MVLSGITFAGVLLGAGVGGETLEDFVVVTKEEATEQGADTSSASQEGREEEWLRAPACQGNIYRYDISPHCETAANEIVQYCADGSEALDPWWMRYRRSDDTWSNWAIIGWYQCPEDILAQLVENAWRRMPIAPNVISVQPPNGWTLTTVPTIVYVDRAPRTMTTTLLGTPVIIRATPTNYRWTWGDGSGSTNTGSPGAPYPNQTVTHTYMYEEQDVTIRLTTTWSGSFSTDGGSTWSPAPGTATTTSVPVDLHVYNPHSHQVDCDVYDDCLHP